MEPELSYLKRRADEERKAAQRSETPEAREIHTLLAIRYERLMSAANSNEVEAEAEG